MVHALAVVRPTYEETVRLSDQLEDWHNAQPACLRIRSIRSTAFTDANYTIMHRIMLELMYRKCLCVLHRPYLTEHKGDPAYDRSRNICRAAALAMLEMHIELDYEISIKGRMYEDRFMVSNLTLQHFLLASTVVCVDLSESQDLQPEKRRACKDILQRSHDVWAARSSYSSDARHATKILRAVLNKVDGPSVMSSSTPGYDTGATATSSSAGMSPVMGVDNSTGLEPPLSVMNVDMKASLRAAPQAPHNTSMQHMCASMSVLGGTSPCQVPPQHPHSHMLPLTMSQPLHHAHHPTAGPQGMYTYAANPTGGYLNMADTGVEFTPAFNTASELDTLLYSTEGVNWVCCQ
ncbi:hypothetical protein NQ176_g10979 [Zarea fungicola]|uniref:Uncharacterized protein n=1 Tax=Zarea fungicola TaxID=93591 RepID=A0ACC1MDJ8_9HYPO|nr:hypothetical protein NQ176_g10979 [Lecanicillium fungicola]